MTIFLISLYYIINGDLMQRFKAKRRIKKRVFLRIFLFVFFVWLLLWGIKIILLNTTNDYIFKLALNDTVYKYKTKDNNPVFNKLYEYVKDNIINKPDNMLVGNIEYKKKRLNNKTVIVENNNPIISFNENEVTKEENSRLNNNDDKTLVYIYSSHQKESYSMEYMEDYNINPNVFLVSHIIQEKLNFLGIKTVVLEDSITKYLNDNNLSYQDSYKASRYFLKRDIEKYPDVQLFIDLHRDAAKKDITTVTINDKKCAKIMFVVGLEHDNYKINLDLANTINAKILSLYPTLTRGVLQKQGSGVNGIYNQDLKENFILMELGGNENNLNEIVNTIELIVPILGEYINET